ncbi:MAG: RES family NAD+ phosphorylase [Gemmatimonadota bacterium]
MGFTEFEDEFDSIQAWTAHEEALRRQNRYLPLAPDYFAALVEACLEYVVTLPGDDPFYRARIHEQQQRFAYPLDQMGAPPAARARGNRLNPSGIPYLYLASDQDTAIAEVRPWRGALVSIACFTPTGGLRVADLRPDVVESDAAVQWVGWMLSRPAHREDPLAYVASQHLSEVLKSRELDGVVYGSALGMGHNLALFSPGAATPSEVDVFEVSDVHYDYG